MGAPNTARVDPYDKARSSCDAFVSYLVEKGFGNIPAGDMADALALIWSNEKRD